MSKYKIIVEIKRKQKIPYCRNSFDVQAEERGKFDTPNTHMHDSVRACLGTYISIVVSKLLTL